MALIFISYIAGVLTVTAPCILPLLPVIIGGSFNNPEEGKKWKKPLIITMSLAISIIVFTLLLKATTALLGVPQLVWNILSGGIIVFIGITLVYPKVWEKIMLASGLQSKSQRLMSTASSRHSGAYRDMLLGASLGPVFSSCSPTYALIVAAVIPASFISGIFYLTAYALGLASVLFAISIAGSKAVAKLGLLSDPDSKLKKFLGIIFIIAGVGVLFGWDRDFQAFVLEQGWYDPILNLEKDL